MRAPARGPALRLIVLRAADPRATLHFYLEFDLRFVEEKHGDGPKHYAAHAGDLVIEIYPAVEQDRAPARLAGGATLLGFEVDSIEDVLAGLRGRGARVISPPRAGPRGMRAVVEDPDGRAVEIVEPPRE